MYAIYYYDNNHSYKHYYALLFLNINLGVAISTELTDSYLRFDFNCSANSS